MNTPRQPTIAQRSTAFALAALVTLAVLGGIDTLAAQGLQADAQMVQQAASGAANG